MKIFYVYKIKCLKTKEFYIGCRGFNGDPLLDPYMGSGIWAVYSNNGPRVKKILRIFDDRKKAEKYESKMIARNAKSLKCMNCTWTKGTRERLGITPSQ